MKFLLSEPYFTGSHKAWAEGYAKHSRHEIHILKLSGNFWKWRMHGGAITLAKQFLVSDLPPDLILATDMLDLTTFLSLTRHRTASIPTALYFHENQLSYPWSPEDRDVIYKRDKHYGFINYVTALAADAVFFNSEFHLNSFLKELERFLKHFPDHQELDNIEKIRAKSDVLPLGLDLGRFDEVQFENRKTQSGNRVPLILWNHRWEFDKNPNDFFRALTILADRNVNFEVAILGECFSKKPDVFLEEKQKLGERIVQFGYVDNFEEYAQWLWRADILPVTSKQDFFGASVIEAIYCGCLPILPDRLAYPELILSNQHEKYFYKNIDELLAKLEFSLKNYQSFDGRKLQKSVRRFSWQNLAPEYDRRLAKLVVN